MVEIHSATAEIRRGKKEEERRRRSYRIIDSGEIKIFK